MYFEDRHLDAVDFIRDAFRNDLLLEGGLMVHECATLYAPPDAKIPKGEQFPAGIRGICEASTEPTFSPGDERGVTP
jgi:hypothetical protein